MSYGAHFSALIESLYDAGVDEGRWPHALKALTQFTGSAAATFWVMDGSGEPRLPVFTVIDLDPSFVNDYVDHAVAIDPTVQYLVAHPDEPIVHDGLVISERGKQRHAYYDWQKRNSELWFRMVGQVSAVPGLQAGVALH